MVGFIKKISDYISNHKKIAFIIMAALLLELVSAVQYVYTHNMFEAELDKRAESDLTMKALIIKGMLNVMENTLHSHLWDAKHNINHADSMFEATKRIIMTNPKVKGSYMAFKPYFYPEKDRLFEPYAFRDGEEILVKQLAGENGHDYTLHPEYKKILRENAPSWSDPYDYTDNGVVNQLITYSYPLHDTKGDIIAICGLDLSLEWVGDTLNANHIYPSSYVLLLTESGTLISRPHSDQVSKQDVDHVVSIINDSTIKRSPSETGRSKVIHFQDEKKGETMIYYANMRGNPHWQIAVVCYEKEVFAKLHWMGINILILMLLVFCILGLIIRRYIQNEGKLTLANIEKQRINNELHIATAIQEAMLIRDEHVAKRNDVIIDASLVPAREVGGDLFNYFIRDEKLFFCIGDVSGKGVPSALVMAMTQALFRAVSSHEGNPSHIMQTVNETVCLNNKTNMFATLFIGALDLPSGRLRYCNAGHDKPVIINSEGVSLLPVKPNLPAGLFEDFQYEMQETFLQNGTTLFLYTDGLTEARNTSHQQFGNRRTIAALHRLRDATPTEIIRSMSEQVCQFAGEEEQSDDLTMMVIKYTPQVNDYTDYGEVNLTNNISQLKDLHDYLKSVAEKLHLDASLTRKIRLAVEEAVVNVMDYAYPIGKEGTICVKAMANKTFLKLVITDTGVAFNPTEAAKADTTLSAEDRPIGGLGILLVRELMDSINYERINGKNILTLIKKIFN